MDIFSSNLEIILFPLLAILPGVVWLLIFLREDAHPEPPGMILRVFLFGSLSAIPVILIFNFTESLLGVFFSLLLVKVIIIAAIAPFLEEITKYLVVRFSALKHPECDEPVDFMIYAVTAALGFATVENIIFLLPIAEFSLQELVTDSFIRFVGATLLHAIASGIMGYFLAVSVLQKKKFLALLGVLVAIILHALYNSFILLNIANVFIPLLLVIFLFILFLCFNRLRNVDFCR